MGVIGGLSHTSDATNAETINPEFSDIVCPNVRPVEEVVGETCREGDSSHSYNERSTALLTAHYILCLRYIHINVSYLCQFHPVNVIRIIMQRNLALDRIIKAIYAPTSLFSNAADVHAS